MRVRAPAPGGLAAGEFGLDWMGIARDKWWVFVGASGFLRERI